MNGQATRMIVVAGATGRQGRAVTGALLKDGWHVRALTRSPNSPQAAVLSNLGAEVVQADMNDRQSLKRAFAGAYGVYSVQNPMISGLEAEVRQGKHVAEVAAEANIEHLVYGSAGVGRPTGVGSWDSKLEVEAHIAVLGLPVTILRPQAFMELMTDKGYYPAVSTWRIMPKLLGRDRPVLWLSVQDLGVIAAKAFASPDLYLARDITLVSDVKSIEECRALYSRVFGKPPAQFPMPIWMFKRFVGTDLVTMWEWLRTGQLDDDTAPTFAIHPDALSVESWLHQQASRSAA